MEAPTMRARSDQADFDTDEEVRHRHGVLANFSIAEEPILAAAELVSYLLG